jgi:hypothetical protein
MVMVALLVAGVDVMVDKAMVDGAVPFQAASNQKPRRHCPPCPAVTSRRTFSYRVADSQ